MAGNKINVGEMGCGAPLCSLDHLSQKVVKITSLCMACSPPLPVSYYCPTLCLPAMYMGFVCACKMRRFKSTTSTILISERHSKYLKLYGILKGGSWKMPTNSFALYVAKAKAIWPKTWWKWGHVSSLDCTLLCPHYVLENGEARGRNIFSSPQHGHEVFKM